jgi:predicted dienelactone hydrolase
MVLKIKNLAFILPVLMLMGFAMSSFARQNSAEDSTSPITQDGTYQVGERTLELTDESRDQTLETFIWYPALPSDDSTNPSPPDTGGAPYPLVIYSHGWTGAAPNERPVFINHLVSHGFVVVGINHHDERRWPPVHNLVDRPLDILFVLNQLADLEDDALVGVMDTNNVGVTGYSFGAYTSLAVAGARVDFSHLAAWCPNENTALADYCSFIPIWGEIDGYHDQIVQLSDDALWTATTDDRIHAVLPIAPCFGQLLGDRGLKVVSVPTLIIAGTDDTNCPFDIDATYIYKNLGSSDRYLVTLHERDHIAIIRERELIQHYQTAFFGFHLGGKTDYAQYLTPESAEAFRDATLEAQLETDS